LVNIGIRRPLAASRRLGLSKNSPPPSSCATTSTRLHLFRGWVPHLHWNRPANLHWLISNKTDGYAGRQARNRATAWPNNYVGFGRALGVIRIGVGRCAVLLNGRLGLGNSASDVVGGAASLRRCNHCNNSEQYKPIAGRPLPVVDFPRADTHLAAVTN